MDFRLFILSIALAVYVLVDVSLRVSVAADSINRSQTLSDGMTLVSSDATFELGFFTPGNSKYRYLGIWYKNIPVQTVVWVANRDKPIADGSGIFTLNSTGNLVLTQNGTVVWHTSPQKQALNPVAQLLDNGNLVIREEQRDNPEFYLWQSFEHPTDTLLAGMKLGWDYRTGLNTSLTAWRSPDDPSPGDFSWVLVPHSYPEFYMFKGTVKYFRSGPWNGIHTSGAPELHANPLFDYHFVFDNDEAFYQFTLKNKSVITRIVLNQTTYIRTRYVWVEAEKNWMVYASVPRDNCDNYGLCGVYGNCIITASPVCQCLQGFRPKSPHTWDSMDWSQGCVRNKPLNCNESKTDGFAKLDGLKLPDTSKTWVNQSMNLEECRVKCLSNCSCMAYTNTNISGAGSGCALWFGDLIDMRQFSTTGQDLYIRMPASELEAEEPKRTKASVRVAAVIASVAGVLLLGCIIYISKTYLKGYLRPCVATIATFRNNKDKDDGLPIKDVDILLLDFSTVAVATNNFSNENKLGQGGFGPVYKGTLPDGQQIAVKRLSRSSGQGLSEFMNEVKLIAKLQHRNLVKLLACCVQGEEKMLVYEYMPNSSLDTFIFDNTKRKLLDWSKRFHIICGIARGILYLHQDSRLRIIHRDLKASNVLLDDELNPKISDFGVAKTFGGDQTHGNTRRVMGTHGYMAPEYAIDGLFSIKSDVFSFGILLLEIISGKRNKGFYLRDHNQNLVSQTWRLWTERRPLEVVDTSIEDSCPHSEVLRCIKIALLCVQHHPEDRPTMSSVALMLGGQTELTEPQQPGFLKKELIEGDPSSSNKELSSTNDVTLSLLEAR